MKRAKLWNVSKAIRNFPLYAKKKTEIIKEKKKRDVESKVPDSPNQERCTHTQKEKTRINKYTHEKKKEGKLKLMDGQRRHHEFLFLFFSSISAHCVRLTGELCRRCRGETATSLNCGNVTLSFLFPLSFFFVVVVVTPDLFCVDPSTHFLTLSFSFFFFSYFLSDKKKKERVKRKDKKRGRKKAALLTILRSIKTDRDCRNATGYCGAGIVNCHLYTHTTSTTTSPSAGSLQASNKRSAHTHTHKMDIAHRTRNKERNYINFFLTLLMSLLTHVCTCVNNNQKKKKKKKFSWKSESRSNVMYAQGTTFFRFRGEKKSAVPPPLPNVGHRHITLMKLDNGLGGACKLARRAPSGYDGTLCGA